MWQMILQQHFSIRNALHGANEHKGYMRRFTWYIQILFVIASDLENDLIQIRPCHTQCTILTALTLIRNTPLLSTISWMMRPFLPITLPTSSLGTWKNSSAYSSIERARCTDSSVSPLILNVHDFSSSSIFVTPTSVRAACILEPCEPIASPMRSSRTRNSSIKLL